jgi:hypothetical protein
MLVLSARWVAMLLRPDEYVPDDHASTSVAQAH